MNTSKITDPRYVPGVSEHDDDMTDAEWREVMGPISLDPEPWRDRLSPRGTRYESDPVPRIMWTDVVFAPRPGYSQNREDYA